MASSAIDRIALAERQSQLAERKAREDIRASLLEVEKSLQEVKEESRAKVEAFFAERQLLSNRKGSLRLSQVEGELSSAVAGLEKVAGSNAVEAIKFVVRRVCS